MPDKIIEIPNVGRIAFPDTMSDADINAAAGKLYAQKNADHPAPDPKHSWVDTAVDWLPTVAGAVGGGVGAIGGTAFGMGVGGVPGAVGGAALGGAAGEAAKQLINEARGKPVPTMGQAAAGMASQAAVQGGAEAAGAGLGAIAGRLAPAVMQSALKPGVKTTLAAVKSGKVPPVVQTLLDEGINVTPRGVEKLNTVIGATNADIKNAIQSVPFEVNPFKVASTLGETAQKFATQVNPNADLEAVSRVGQEFLQNNPRMIPGTTAQAMKTGTYAQLGNKAYTGELKGAEVEAQKALARGLKDEIAAEVSRAGGPDITALNAREGAAITARDAVARRVAVGGNNNPLGLAALAVSHPVTFLTTLMDRSPAVKSLIARGLYTTAGAVGKVSPQLIRVAVQTIASSPDEEPK